MAKIQLEVAVAGFSALGESPLVVFLHVSAVREADHFAKGAHTDREQKLAVSCVEHSHDSLRQAPHHLTPGRY